MQTAGLGPDLMSTAVIAKLSVTASGHLGNPGSIGKARSSSQRLAHQFDPPRVGVVQHGGSVHPIAATSTVLVFVGLIHLV